ncbi:MAG: hypothetical protein ABI566_12380 [Pseudolysinimonas sp.]
MTHVTTLERQPLNPRFTIILATTVLLVGAFFLLPGTVARVLSPEGITTGMLAESVGVAFSQWWTSAAAPLTPGMEAVVSFWAVFHVTKVVVAIALLIALLLTGHEVWKAYARATGRVARAGIALLGIAGAPLAPLMLLIVMANVQGSLAPLSSVMGLLPMDGSVPEVAEVQAQFAAGTSTPVLDALISDFRTYHLVVVVVAVIAALLVVAADIVLWIRWSRIVRQDVRLRRVTATVAIVLPALAPVLLFIMVVNLSTVAETAPALAAFFQGSL